MQKKQMAVALHPIVSEKIQRIADDRDQSAASIQREIIYDWFLKHFTQEAKKARIFPAGHFNSWYQSNKPRSRRNK